MTVSVRPDIAARKAADVLNLARRRAAAEDRSADDGPRFASYGYDFQAGMRRLAHLTQRQQQLEARLQAAIQTFLIQQCGEDLAEFERVNASRADQEDELREHALKAWEITGKRTHVKGCGVRVSARLRIHDTPRALAWCEANHPAAVQRTVDESLFKGDVQAGVVDPSVAQIVEEAVSTIATPDTLLRDWLAE